MGKATTDLALLTQGAHKKKRAPIRVGRQTDLTPEVSKKICDAVRAGNFASVAARYAGVSQFTLDQWIARGRGTHPTRPASKVYVQFVQDLDAAEAAAEVQANIHWRTAMPKDWKASQKWLEVRYPERYAPQQPGNAPGNAYAALQVNFGVPGAQNGPNSPENAEMGAQVPLTGLLEANPQLIAATMSVLDQFLPESTELLQMGANEPLEAEFAEIGDTDEQFGASNDDL